MTPNRNQYTAQYLYYSYFKRVPRVTTDTRRIEAGSVFFALRGESFNGNNFAEQALANGCAYAVVDDESLRGRDVRLLFVDDVLSTLQHLAALHRREFGLPVLQITGTNGKTTTKELCSAVLAKQFNVLFTQGNLNNHIGVPLTLLRLRADHEIAVIETGANHPGEIAALCAIVHANCGLITNVGRAHLEGFGSFEGVVRTKSELYDDLRTRSDSFVFLHADNDILCEKSRGLPAVTYGTVGHGYYVEGEVLGCNPFLAFRWRKQDGAWHDVQTHLIGSYNVTNALAACAVGLRFGVDENDICEAIAEYQPTNSRSELRETGHNRLIVDAYNANPTSMAAALENFRLLPFTHKMLILGQMGELGDVSAEEHQHLVAHIEEVGAEKVWLVGKAFRPFAGRYRFFEHVDEVAAELRAHPVEGYTILLKGSNSTRLHQLPPLL
ncbi:MAG: UDP-N-acetylmuramoyl-tripeptide--D-alanyl-D-alanine ligase [Alloprevotella sp.]|nr:UDP-N-acetylmuramoyl-tripeptide--D-alanyl-D-alanine ligase [Alloprevotella sp.]